MTPLSKGIQQLPDIGLVNLKDNRLSQVGANTILKSLNKNLKALDISENNIGNEGVKLLSNYL